MNNISYTFQVSTCVFLISSLFFIGCQAASPEFQMEYKSQIGNIVVLSLFMQFFSSLFSHGFWKLNQAMRYWNTQMFGVNSVHFLF